MQPATTRQQRARNAHPSCPQDNPNVRHQAGRPHTRCPPTVAAALSGGPGPDTRPSLCAAGRRARQGRAGLDLHQQHRPLQPVRVPRHHARPTRSPRSRAASTSATRAASTSAPGRRTSAGSPDSAARRVGQHGVGLLRRLQGQPARRLRLRPRRPLLLVPRHLPRRLHQAATRPSSTPRCPGSGSRSSTAGAPTTRRSAFPIRAARSYLDLTASYDVIDKVNDAIGKVTLFGHLGHQWYSGNQASFSNSNYNYGDWKVGASTEVYGVTVGIYGTGTNAQDQYYTNGYGKNISANQFVGFIQKTF